MDNNDFSAERSLALIQSMIEKVKQNLSENSFYFILWGWAVLLAAWGQYALKVFFAFPYHYYTWLLTVVAAVVSIIYGIKKEKKVLVKTQLSEMMKYFGIATGISFASLSFIASSYLDWGHAFPIYFVMYGFASFVAGGILNYKPLRWAGIFCWIISVVSTFVGYDEQMLLMGLVVIVAYLVPGYLLKKFKPKAHYV